MKTHFRAKERHLPYVVTCHPTQVKASRKGTRFTYTSAASCVKKVGAAERFRQNFDI